jgi:hypothetical protein
LNVLDRRRPAAPRDRSGGNLQAVDRAVKIVCELDRYHGCAVAQGRPHDEVRSAFAGAPSHALEALMSVRPEMSPQCLENIDSAPGIGMASNASNPQDMVRGREETFGPALAAPEQSRLVLEPQTIRLEKAPQAPEKIKFALGKGCASRDSEPQHLVRKHAYPRSSE